MRSVRPPPAIATEARESASIALHDSHEAPPLPTARSENRFVRCARRRAGKGALQHRWLTPDELNPAPPRASRLAEVANSMTKLPVRDRRHYTSQREPSVSSLVAFRLVPFQAVE